MMRICNEVDYAVRAMIVLASHKNQLLSSKEISKAYGIPYNFLTLILPRLVRARLIVSVQGPKGGYKLNQGPEKIRVYDVVNALDSSVSITTCSSEEGCKFDRVCGMAHVWKKLNNQIEDYLKTITLDQVLLSDECLEKIKKL